VTVWADKCSLLDLPAAAPALERLEAPYLPMAVLLAGGSWPAGAMPALTRLEMSVFW
jgi:hypothetical protein